MMIKTLFFYPLAIVLFCLTNTVAQEININIAGVTHQAVLVQLEGEKTSKIDSIISINGNFQFSLTNKNTGFYRLQFDNRHWIDFINDGKDIEIKTDYNNIPALPAGRLDSLKVIKSESNKIYYEFTKLNKSYKTKTELLQLILARYPKEDEYYQITKEKLIQVQEDYLYFVNVTSQVDPNSFIARYINSAQLPVVETDIQFDKQLAYLKTHALDNVNFYDDELSSSDLFTNKTIEYLTYYRNPQLPLELLEKEFMIAVDTILTKAKVNSIVYQHIVEYLIDGFKKFGFDNIIDYIVENYVIKDDLCLDSKLQSSIERRIDQARYFKIGNTVPDIISSNTTGKQIELNKINAEEILILFYASWCPHCQTLLPEIYDLYKKQEDNKIAVFAVSIDTSKTDWLKFIKTNKLDWINVSDLQGWYSKAAKDYFLYATPTMILINKEKKVIAKPSSIEELKKLILLE